MANGENNGIGASRSAQRACASRTRAASKAGKLNRNQAASERNQCGEKTGIKKQWRSGSGSGGSSQLSNPAKMAARKICGEASRRNINGGSEKRLESWRENGIWRLASSAGENEMVKIGIGISEKPASIAKMAISKRRGVAKNGVKRRRRNNGRRNRGGVKENVVS